LPKFRLLTDITEIILHSDTVETNFGAKAPFAFFLVFTKFAVSNYLYLEVLVDQRLSATEFGFLQLTVIVNEERQNIFNTEKKVRISTLSRHVGTFGENEK
jgi:hypothetical protein